MKQASIVVIEDNPADVLLITMALDDASLDYSLTHFECGRDAVRALCHGRESEGVPEFSGVNGNAKGDGPPPDVILLDLNTPQSDGFEVLRAFRASRGLDQVPIAILTSSRAMEDKRRAARMGARFVEKPSSLQEFLTSVGEAVKEMLSGSPARGREAR